MNPKRALRLAALLPETPSRYDGSPFAWWFAAASLVVVTARSVVHLLLALLLWVLLLRYRGLVPLVLLVFLVEPVLREVAGRLKPIETLGTAPGAALNWVVVPVVAAMSWLSLRTAREAGRPPS